MEIVKPEKHVNMIALDGFVFRIERVYRDSICWRCIVEGCKARRKTENDYENN